MLHFSSLAALFVLASSSIASESICIDAHVARERTRITAHLTAVEKELRAVDTAHLNDDARMKRARLLDTLHAYTARGVFPQNKVTHTRTPIFVDDGARTCAVAELLMSDGRSDVVREVVSRENLARVPVMRTEGLLAWAATRGFTVDELARIQPSYAGPSFCGEDCIAEPCTGPIDGCTLGETEPVCDALGRKFRNSCVAGTCGAANAPRCTVDNQGGGCACVQTPSSTTFAAGSFLFVALFLRRRRS